MPGSTPGGAIASAAPLAGGAAATEAGGRQGEGKGKGGDGFQGEIREDEGKGDVDGGLHGWYERDGRSKACQPQGCH